MSLAELMGDVGSHYPGSKETRAPNPVVEDDPPGPDLPAGQWLLVNGTEVEFFGIGDLARVLNRKPGTIRMWETAGLLPTSGYTKPGKDKDPRGQRRIWSKPQIEGIWSIACDEGILDPGPRVNIRATRFTARVTALFRQLKEEK